MHKYWKLPAILVIANPWEALGVDLIGSYPLNDKDETEIDFMGLTMIDPASSQLEIVELTVVTDAVILTDTMGQRDCKTHNITKLPYFDNSSTMISN